MLGSTGAKSVLDIGCGNGALCGELAMNGYAVTGYDPSETGIALARQRYPKIPFHRIGIDADPRRFEPNDLDAVVATEVIEHLYEPSALLRFAEKKMASNATLILSTPYHGYWKNLALSIAGKWDFHLGPLWDGGHIKFWSRATLTALLAREGFEVLQFVGAGRIPFLWKSMVLLARKVPGAVADK